MYRALRVFVAVLVLTSLVAPTIATARAAPVSAADAAQQTNAWITRLTLWSTPYNNLTLEQTNQLYVISEGVTTLTEFLERGDTAGARAWFGPWAEQQRAALAYYRTRLEALRDPQPGLVGPGYDVRTMPNSAALQTAFAKVPIQTARHMALTEQLALNAIDLIGRASGGDPEAAIALGRFYFDMTKSKLEAEISLNETYVPISALFRSPQEQVLQTAIAVNRGILGLLEVIRAETFGEASNRPAAAAVLRAQAGAVDRAAVELQRRTAAVRSEPVPGELGSKYRRLAASLDQSHLVLVDIAGRLRSLADELERGGTLESAGFERAITELSERAVQLQQQDQERKAILAG